MRYLAQFWSNDGRWHETSHEYRPVYMFTAKNDGSALSAAATFAEGKRPSKDCHLRKLVRWPTNGSMKIVDLKRKPKGAEAHQAVAEFKEMKVTDFLP